MRVCALFGSRVHASFALVIWARVIVYSIARAPRAPPASFARPRLEVTLRPSRCVSCLGLVFYAGRSSIVGCRVRVSPRACGCWWVVVRRGLPG